jgi:hypothetical protein
VDIAESSWGNNNWYTGPEDDEAPVAGPSSFSAFAGSSVGNFVDASAATAGAPVSDATASTTSTVVGSAQASAPAASAAQQASSSESSGVGAMPGSM